MEVVFVSLAGAMSGLFLLSLVSPVASAWKTDLDDGSGYYEARWCHGKTQVNVWDATSEPYRTPNSWAMASLFSLPVNIQVAPYGTSSSHDVKIQTYSRDTWESAELWIQTSGKDAADRNCFVSYPVPAGCTCTEASSVRLNTFWMWDDNNDKREAIVVHELVHALGLGHESTLSYRPLMYPN